MRSTCAATRVDVAYGLFAPTASSAFAITPVDASPLVSHVSAVSARALAAALAPRDVFAIAPPGIRIPLRGHEGDGDHHLHEMSVDALGAVRELIWKIDNVELTTVGIDIGSSTSHLMFSRVHLQRKTQQLSSQFVVVDRTVLWRSPILLTPFLPDNTIDAVRLGEFIGESYRSAGLARDEVDTGAVILTGEAIKRTNAEAIAELFAADAGKFVCASAGHHLECVLAANGSGAVAMSRQQGSTVLNVDIGGGTTKLALVSNGEILGTCALAVGGRLIAFDAHGRLARIDESAQHTARLHDIALEVGAQVTPADVERIVGSLADAVIALIRQERPTGLARELLLIPANIDAAVPDAITFSGGVSEYIYGTRADDVRRHRGHARGTHGGSLPHRQDRHAAARARARASARP